MPDQISSIDLSWLDWQNEIQVKWALNYFSKKGFAFLRAWAIEDAQLSLKAWLEEKQTDSQTLLLARAQNAWRQQKHRTQKPGYKAYNFVLPTKVQATLKQLARMQRTNMTEALKNLVEEALVVEKHYQKARKALERKHKQARDELTEKRKKAEQQVRTHARSIADHTLTVRALAAEIKDLLRQKVENELQITRESASPDELTALDELHAEELEKLKQRLPLQSRFDAFSSRPSQHVMPHRTAGSDSPPLQKRAKHTHDNGTG